MKHPVIPVALGYGAGVVLGYFLEAPLLLAFLAALAVALTAVLSARVRPLLLPLLLLLFGWLNLSVRTALVSPHDVRTLFPDHMELVTVRGRLAETASQRVTERHARETWHTLAELEVTALQRHGGPWQPASGSVMTRTDGVLDEHCLADQSVEVTGIAMTPPLPVAEGVFDYRRYLRLRNIHYELKVEDATDWQVTGATNTRPIDVRFRAWAQRTLARGLPEQDEALRLQWAMLLGWQTALTAEVSEPFMRSGTMHIFAISGLHIALIAGIFLALFRAVLVPRAVCGVVVVGIIWFYTWATGWQASAIRSTVMMTVIIAGWSLKRPTNLLNSLAVAACVILVWQPGQLFQASFQLSFFVVLSIALLSPPIETFRKRMFTLDPLLPYELRPRWQRAGIWLVEKVWQGFAVSLAAFLGSMPLIAYYFHLFTPGSLLANLVVVPVSSLALMSGLGALVTGDLIPAFTEWFNHAGWRFMRSMIWLSQGSANLPAAWCHVRAPGLLGFTLYYGLLLAGCAGWFTHRTRRRIVIGAAVLLTSLWIFNWRSERAWHRLTALPLSGGHAVFVQPRGAGEWLLDCGSESAVDFTVKPFLQAQGVNHLDSFLLTHGDARQVGGAGRLQRVFPVRQAFASPVPSRSPRYREALLEVESRLHKSATNGFEFAPWKFLHPSAADNFPNADDDAVVALGTFDDVRVLCASDLGRLGQSAVVVRHPELRADIVIAGLPATGEPLADEWLAALRPKLIVVIDSEIPATRRASRELARRLRRSGAEVLFTREAGAVTISIRHGAWHVETALSP